MYNIDKDRQPKFTPNDFEEVLVVAKQCQDSGDQVMMDYFLEMAVDLEKIEKMPISRRKGRMAHLLDKI